MAETQTNREESTDRKSEFFKKQSQKSLEQCGTLAEQLICLRNDLDRSHFDMIKIQRQRSTSLTSYYSCSPSLPLTKSESEFELLMPEEPPRPTQPDSRVTLKHSRQSSQDSDLVNRSFVQQKKKSLASTKSLNVSDCQPGTRSAKLLPPRAPLVSHYHSNSKYLASGKHVVSGVGVGMNMNVGTASNHNP